MPETISIKHVYDELKKIEREMITKNELDSLFDTLAVINNPETMKQLLNSAEDIKQNRVKEIHSVKDILG
ncbi:hypothetical protein HYY69_00020 [Candidatus Woesearchaeota archaeon]|nr:hypothetical protein [Candidatus Woesearchaeota archaeon]